MATAGRPKRDDGRNSTIAAVQKYAENNYDRINFYIKKGEKDKIKAMAKSHGETINTYLNRLLAADIQDFSPLNQNDSIVKKKTD